LQFLGVRCPLKIALLFFRVRDSSHPQKVLGVLEGASMTKPAWSRRRLAAQVIAESNFLAGEI
jgi:hypothetical protein